MCVNGLLGRSERWVNGFIEESMEKGLFLGCIPRRYETQVDIGSHGVVGGNIAMHDERLQSGLKRQGARRLVGKSQCVAGRHLNFEFQRFHLQRTVGLFFLPNSFSNGGRTLNYIDTAKVLSAFTNLLCREIRQITVIRPKIHVRFALL